MTVVFKKGNYQVSAPARGARSKHLIESMFIYYVTENKVWVFPGEDPADMTSSTNDPYASNATKRK